MFPFPNLFDADHRHINRNAHGAQYISARSCAAVKLYGYDARIWGLVLSVAFVTFGHTVVTVLNVNNDLFPVLISHKLNYP